MITLYSGTPGSGKSLHAAVNVKGRLRMGEMVVTNYEIDEKMIKHPENFVYLPNHELTPKHLLEVANYYWSRHGGRVKEGKLLLVIDEAQLMFNARQWQTTDAKGWISWFTQHRKYGYDVILVAQFDRMLDRQIRSLIEYEYIHRKVNNYGKFGFFLNLLFWQKLQVFVWVKMWYPLRERLEARFFVARPGLYRLYDTYKILDK